MDADLLLPVAACPGILDGWLAIPGWEGVYEVNRSGGVRSLPWSGLDRLGRRKHVPGTVLNPYPNSKGYLHVDLTRSGRRATMRVNRAVLTAFVGPPGPGQEAAHINGRRDDNRLENLAWKSKKENSGDQYIHGTRVMGERSGRVSLTEALVRIIRARFAAGEKGHRIAADLNINDGTVWHVVNRRTWRHVE